VPLVADAPCGFVFQNPDHQVVMPSVGADVAFGLGRWAYLVLANTVMTSTADERWALLSKPWQLLVCPLCNESDFR
jgi:hypothetical protein